MLMLNSVVLGPRSIERNTTVKGVLVGQARVRPGVEFLVEGVVTGDVIVERGGSAEIRGTVNGRVLNHGGTVKVLGITSGVVEYAV